MQAGADLFKYDNKKFTPFHYAVVKDHVAVLEYLKKEKKVNFLDKQHNCNGFTLLALAIQNGSYNVVKMLVDWGADPHELDKEKFSYLHVAAMSGHVNIFLFFLSKQLSLNAKNSKGDNAMELAK